MKALIISHNCFSTTQSMGKTFASLFSAFKQDELMQLYLYPTIPNTGMCKELFRITDDDVIHSVFDRKSKCGRIIRPEEIKDWINLDSWINGETGGYLRVTRESRNWFDTDFPQILAEPPKKLDGSERGKEHCSYIIESLETGRKYRGHFNVMNEGCITNLPSESVVEVPCYVDGNGISVPKVGELPLGCAAVCSQSIWVQKLAVEAAVSGDVNLLKQAALMDPLTGAVCNPPEIWQMIDEMLVAQEQWLPQYKEAIAQAKENLKRPDLLPVKEGYRGAVRLKEKTVAEVAAEKEERKITV